MRKVPPQMTEAWKSAAHIGDQRPIVRATIQKQDMRQFEYDTAWSQGGTFGNDRHRPGVFKSFVFGDNSFVREIRNIKTCSWERSIDQDAATCTLTILNTDLTAIGEPRDNPTSPDEFDKPGYFTFNRGDQTVSSNRWGFDDETGWNSVFVPDRVVRTYEGYSADFNTSPADDPNLLQSGTWMIDKVVYNADATITLEMRDLGRLLLDQVVFPPGVPITEYPLSWSRTRSENVPYREAKGGNWVDRLRRFGTATSSNEKYIGKGFTNSPFKTYVQNSGAADGHHPRHAIVDHATVERDAATFWRSTGQDSGSSFVWWEYTVDEGRMPLAAIRLRMVGGPYRIYISVHNGERWIGRKKIGWKKNGRAGSPGDVDIDAKIPFVATRIADRHFAFDVTLPRAYEAKKVRITVTRLQSYRVGEHPYRGGIREVQFYTADKKSDLHFEKGEMLKVVGNYGDWTHVVKWVCAWAGWYWPPHSTELDFVNTGFAGLDKIWLTYTFPDPSLPTGRVWGDFMRSGTAGVADLTVDLFDKKPLMDIINYVRDLLGYLFFVDEVGGAVWRMPNIWSLGNYLIQEEIADGRTRGRWDRSRTTDIVTIDEKETLLDYSTTLDSMNLRERIFVANVVGGVGTVIKGFNPYPVGLNRVTGWTDQNFKTKRETRVMADMISARNMFTYRTSQVTIPGYPAIQIDDQVRIFERVTNETYYHYVLGIKSELNVEDGTWIYSLNTHWLGERPSDAWAVRIEELDSVTQTYLNAVGYEPTGNEDKDE